MDMGALVEEEWVKPPKKRWILDYMSGEDPPDYSTYSNQEVEPAPTPPSLTKVPLPRQQVNNTHTTPLSPVSSPISPRPTRPQPPQEHALPLFQQNEHTHSPAPRPQHTSTSSPTRTFLSDTAHQSLPCPQISARSPIPRPSQVEPAHSPLPRPHIIDSPIPRIHATEPPHSPLPRPQLTDPAPLRAQQRTHSPLPRSQTLPVLESPPHTAPPPLSRSQTHPVLDTSRHTDPAGRWTDGVRQLAEAQETKRRSQAGTREVHNKLEKNRRAHLKECFDQLKMTLPNMDEKKSSNLSILRGALRYIHNLKRREREYELEMERLAREKIAAQQRLATLKKELSSQWDHLDMNLLLPDSHVSPGDRDTNSTSTALEQGDEGDGSSKFSTTETSPSNSSHPTPTKNHSTAAASSHRVDAKNWEPTKHPSVQEYADSASRTENLWYTTCPEQTVSQLPTRSVPILSTAKTHMVVAAPRVLEKQTAVSDSKVQTHPTSSPVGPHIVHTTNQYPQIHIPDSSSAIDRKVKDSNKLEVQPAVQLPRKEKVLIKQEDSVQVSTLPTAAVQAVPQKEKMQSHRTTDQQPATAQQVLLNSVPAQLQLPTQVITQPGLALSGSGTLLGSTLQLMTPQGVRVIPVDQAGLRVGLVPADQVLTEQQQPLALTVHTNGIAPSSTTSTRPNLAPTSVTSSSLNRSSSQKSTDLSPIYSHFMISNVPGLPVAVGPTKTTPLAPCIPIKDAVRGQVLTLKQGTTISTVTANKTNPANGLVTRAASLTGPNVVTAVTSVGVPIMTPLSGQSLVSGVTPIVAAPIQVMSQSTPVAQIITAPKVVHAPILKSMGVLNPSYINTTALTTQQLVKSPVVMVTTSSNSDMPSSSK